MEAPTSLDSLAIIYFFLFLFIYLCEGNYSLEGGLVPSLEEFESRSKGPTTLRAIGLRSTPY